MDPVRSFLIFNKVKSIEIGFIYVVIKKVFPVKHGFERKTDDTQATKYRWNNIMTVYHQKYSREITHL